LRRTQITVVERTRESFAAVDLLLKTKKNLRKCGVRQAGTPAKTQT
jgi:hypothetical protein